MTRTEFRLLSGIEAQHLRACTSPSYTPRPPTPEPQTVSLPLSLIHTPSLLPSLCPLIQSGFLEVSKTERHGTDPRDFRAGYRC